MNSDFYAFDDNFVVLRRKKGVEFQKIPRVELVSSTAGSREFHYWNSRIPLLELNFASSRPLNYK